LPALLTRGSQADAENQLRGLARGRVPGRKPKITAEQKMEIVEAVSSGRKTPAEIARLLKIQL
jgi:DNA-binding CsgD family transcriptional regulator